MTVRRLVLAAALVVLGACAVPVVQYQPRFGLAACNNTLPGSEQLAEIDLWRVPITCEQRDVDTPWWAEGYFDLPSRSIRIYPKVHASEPDTYALKAAGHEFGHWWGEVLHPEEQAAWAAWRGLSWQPDMTGEIPAQEDFAESWAYCNYGWTPGASFTFWHGTPDAGACATMRGWHG